MESKCAPKITTSRMYHGAQRFSLLSKANVRISKYFNLNPNLIPVNLFRRFENRTRTRRDHNNCTCADNVCATLQLTAPGCLPANKAVAETCTKGHPTR
jgi:hypothetical protein